MKDIGYKRLTVDVPIELFLRLKAIATLKNVTLKHYVNRMVYDKVKTEEDYLKPPGGK